MKITYSPLQLDIDMPENIIVNLVLENPYDFTEFVMDLQSQFEGEDGLSILSEGSRELNWYKAGSIITDFIGLSVNSKKVLNHLYKLMETIGCEEAELKGNLLTQSVQALEKIISSMKYDCITYNLDFAWHDFFKMFNVHIADDTELLSEKLINYMRVCSDLLGNKILCLVNAKSYFPKKILWRYTRCLNILNYICL